MALKNYNYGGRMGVGYMSFEPAGDTKVYLEYLENPKTPVFEKVCRLGSKSAWVVRDTANGLVCLQSYNTIVAIKNGRESIDLGKFSVTTTGHQSAFLSWCRECEG